jgi:enterochelin esterase-like enzyme
MHRNRLLPRGSVQRIVVESGVLAANLLGDSCERAVDVYTPPGFRADQALPLLVDLVGFTGSGLSHTAFRNFGENVPERIDRLIAEGALPPVVIAFPDCFTRLGGNQYINSAAIGRWEDFLIDEMLPAVEQRFGCGGLGRRGLFGKSSGGYGSLVHGLRHADTWAAVACHSGDMAFELSYGPQFPNVLRGLAKHELSIERWVKAFEAGKKHEAADVSVLEQLAMAASYDPDPTQFLGVRMPVDLETCELIEERWANWRAWDPLNMLAAGAENLGRLKALYIDCGTVDQFNLVYGARRLHRALDRLGVRHVYEEFPDSHSGIDYRMDRSLPLLVRALAS